MTDTSFGIDWAIRLSIVRIYPHHSAHAHPCPGMVADDAYTTGPHGKALLGRNLPLIDDAHSTDFDGLGDQQEDNQSDKWQGKQQSLLTQCKDHTTSGNESAPGAACLGHQQGCSDDEQGRYGPQKLPTVCTAQHLCHGHEVHEHEKASKRHINTHRSTDPKANPMHERLG